MNKTLNGAHTNTDSLSLKTTHFTMTYGESER